VRQQVDQRAPGAATVNVENASVEFFEWVGSLVFAGGRRGVVSPG
jgi:hypothetical protein